MRRHDWRKTSLGPPEHWPQALRSMVRVLLTSRYQMCIGWGKDLAFLYNDAYYPTLGGKHPGALGQPAASVWREIWSEIGPLIEQVMNTGEAIYSEGMQLFLERSGFREETFHTFSFSPLFDDHGTIAGLFCVVVEETERIISARRLATLRELAAAAAHATQQAALFATIATQLSANPHDLPFALVYIFDADGNASLAAASGIEAGHAAAPRVIEPQRHPWLRSTFQQSATVELVDDLAHEFSALPTGAWNQPPRAALVVPIAQHGSPQAAGVFVAAINPHRPLDTAYRDFVSLVASQIASAVASVRNFVATVRRDAARAVMLSEQRLQLSQDRLSRALSTGRVAVYEWNLGDRVNLYGPLTEAFGVSEEEGARGMSLKQFMSGIHPDDRARTTELADQTVTTGKPYEAEYRIIRGHELRTVLSRGHTVTMPSGERNFTGVLIDLTQEKAVEQQLRANEQALLEQTRALEVLNRAAGMIAGEVNTERVVQTITDAGVELIGAQFGAFFYVVQHRGDERYMLYTLSGAAPDAFASFPMPRRTAVFGPTFDGIGIVRSEDITQDPRYGKNGPYRGMPPGHLPVKSYLAVPVKSVSGEALGGLFFGHELAAQFDARDEELIMGLAATAAVAMDNARLVQTVQRELGQRRLAEAELQQLNSLLEQRVREEVAERARAEEALRHAQKMEAVGQLTGGVAHDFNNLLTVIIGGLDTIRRARSSDEVRIRRAAEMALQGAQRAAQLTSRLLAFSRRQPLSPRPLDLNMRVRDMTELLHRTLGESVELEGILAPRLWSAEIDQSQLENAILNLAVNARDAMHAGGKLTIETANTLLDESYTATDAEVVPGQYVMVAVSDTGTGMPKQVLARAFEPFFTTKDVGKGTGLGLSMVYGFVKQSGGHVTICSEPRRGTTVKLYFPRYRGSTPVQPIETERVIPTASSDEVVLVVEDNLEVRSYSVMVLTELGYRVLEAEDAPSALQVLQGGTDVDLLFTDVVLPGKSGKILAEEARLGRPNLRVLYTTGYSRDAIVHHGRLDAGVHLISKPFTLEELARRVRDVLDHPLPAN
jgi:signal transduction histidine kinase